jgi:hypothetical protein
MLTLTRPIASEGKYSDLAVSSRYTNRLVYSYLHYICINSCLQWLVMECMVSHEAFYHRELDINIAFLEVMHTDVYASLEKMTVSPNVNARMATKDLVKRSPNTERKRRNRQVRVELSVNGTPRLTPDHVSLF